MSRLPERACSTGTVFFVMTLSVLLAISLFFVVATITPGPNNMMLLSSGATFGFRRTVPQIIGISLGGTVMTLALGWSLGGIAAYLPAFYVLLHIVSTLYMLWLAWRIATSSGPRDAHVRKQPLSTLNAAAFQWVNPKAWAMALGAVASFARHDHFIIDVAIIAVVRIIVGLPCISLWAGSGLAMRQLLHREKALRLFNIGMAALLVLSILPEAWSEVAKLMPNAVTGQ
jgi:threonine/homoserine/homoserine lactone efflux protein